MTPDRISHYRLEDKLGEGGMGVVYRAVDEKLERSVALKFLSRSLASDESLRTRFMQEARAASSLDHPNICTIFEIDETEDGELFIAMAYYPGETLDQRLKRGPLEVDSAIAIAAQVARGLAAAHEELIIHRDIKPGNIMLTDKETVKILDFGLAKLADRPGITRPDSSIGTPSYMSPEQIRSETVDQRTDIWSLGVVLHEMFSGRIPFKGERTESLIHSILNDEPTRISSVRSGLPRGVERILSRALAKSPRARYEKMTELISDLQQLRAEIDSGERTIRRPAEKKRTSVAVLPFVNMSADPEQQYFCDGIAEELLIALSEVPELHVASRTSAFQFKGSSMDIRDIGEKLNVSTVLEGSVRKAGDRVRVTAQLINIEDGYRLWSDRYDREISDIFAIQDEIARNIAQALEVTLKGEDQAEPERAAPTDVEAYDLYLRGQQFFHQHRRKGYEIARQMFRNAIEIDPNYARAWAGIANCSSSLHFYFGHGQEAVEEAQRASTRALEIDPDLAEARVSRGLALSLAKEYDEAERELKRAIELNPSSFDAHYFYGRLYQAQGKLPEAAAMYQKACSITPEAYFTWVMLGGIYKGMGEETKANAAYLEGIEATKTHLRVHPDDTRAWAFGAACLSELGEPEKAEEWVDRALVIDSDEPLILYNAACVYAYLGNIDKSIDALRRTIDLGYIQKEWMVNDPDLEAARSDPRFGELLERMERGAQG